MDNLYPVKSPRTAEERPCEEQISAFGGESNNKVQDGSFYASIGMKGMDGKGKYFSIDFTDATLRKGDHVKYNKTTEMRADEFWEELTTNSKTSVARIITEAKMKGVSSIKDKLEALELMFKKPDVVLGHPAINQASFLSKIV